MIEEIAGSELGAKLRSQVAAWHPDATRDDIDEAFQEACVIAQRACRGQHQGEVFTWLRTTTHRQVGQMLKAARKRAGREVLVDVTTVELAAVETRTPDQELIEREDEADVERATAAVLEQLSERQREIAVLHSHGRRRPEIAEHLGITNRSVKRALEHIMAVGRTELVRLAGNGCEAGEALVARFAFGLATPREKGQAQLHLAGCPQCGALYERLGLWHDKVASLLPVPAVAGTTSGTVERAVDVGVGNLADLKDRVVDRGGALRDHLVDGGNQLKQHAATAYYRAVDPTPLAAVRPGPAVATIASCLVIGGGAATYCVEQGIGPVGSSSPKKTQAVAEKPRAKPKRKRPTAEQPAPSPTTTATTPTPAAQEPDPEPAAQPTTTAESTTPTPAPPAPQDEYEPVEPSAASASATSSSSTQSSRSEPAPAPSDGPGEFDGP